MPHINLPSVLSSSQFRVGMPVLGAIVSAIVVFLLLDVRLAPAQLSMQTIDGKAITLQVFRGRPVLVTFWATTCTTCIEELPELNCLYKRWAAQGFEILSVAMQYDPPDRVVRFAKNKRLPYPVVLDIDGRISRAFGNITLTPSHFLISPNGIIVDSITGKFSPMKLHKKLSRIFEI